jgi:hypothetical protein
MKTSSTTRFSIVILIASLRFGAGPPAFSAEKLGISVRLIGCLVDGDDPGEVWLVDKHGTIYGLEGDKRQLKSYLGHRVTVTGYVLQQEREEANPDKRKEHPNSKSQDVDFRVLKVETIGTKCK